MISRWMPLVLAAALSCGGSVELPPADACTGDAQCDDQDPCTVDTCGADRRCAHAAAPDGPAPASTQTAGDCLVVVCSGGKAGTQPDDGDVADDGNPCTVDTCSSGTPEHVAAPEGAVCTDSGQVGHCDHLGGCLATDCDPMTCMPESPCAVGDCSAAGQCVFTPVPDGTPTPGQPQVAGDCRTNVCVGGAEASAVDDSDLPAQQSPCVSAACANGVPSFVPMPAGTICPGGSCDGAGNCV